jgi:hypothetical protein
MTEIFTVLLLMAGPRVSTLAGRKTEIAGADSHRQKPFQKLPTPYT